MKFEVNPDSWKTQIACGYPWSESEVDDHLDFVLRIIGEFRG